MKKTLTKQQKAKVNNWRWRMIKACGGLKKFAEKTDRCPSQISDWLNGVKTPTSQSIDSVENDLKALGA